ncbi:transmembrane protein 216-like isoform X3 [Chiloscyllium punctatum]|uniref:transmembrane protein 216-like isoform X3 n=1 Tax=Chiloscyllium punctatum TaxID=137246 RepID=UPI003B63E676
MLEIRVESVLLEKHSRPGSIRGAGESKPFMGSSLTCFQGQLLPYTSANLTLDLVMLFLYLGVEIMRIFFGSKGNLCQRKVPLTISLVLLGPSTIMAVYYMLLQTYVLRLEVIINAILLVFYVFELVLYTVGLISFSSVIISD